MKITQKEVRYVAELANLRLTEAEVAKFGADLGEILEYIDKLNEIDISGVEPMAQVLFEAEETATLRADIPVAPLGNAAALANAPQPGVAQALGCEADRLKSAQPVGAGYFKVPRVIER